MLVNSMFGTFLNMIGLEAQGREERVIYVGWASDLEIWALMSHIFAWWNYFRIDNEFEFV